MGMSVPRRLLGSLVPSSSDQHLAKQLKDYADVGISLLWRRQLALVAANGLAAAYYSFWIAAASQFLIGLSEFYDYRIFKRIQRWDGKDPRLARAFMVQTCFGTVFSAMVVCFFVISIAVQQDTTSHFMPLFLLFAAGLFAAMNNHQLLPVLTLRLTMYGVAFIFIPLRDIWLIRPALSSELWLHFFVVVFVLFFLVDTSMMFLSFYRRNQQQLDLLAEEFERTKAAYKAKSEFLSMMSHELKTPLSSVVGSIDLIASGATGPLPSATERVSEIAQANGKRLSSLIGDLLDMQDIDSENLRLELEPVEVGGLLAQAIESAAPLAKEANVSIDFSQIDSEVYVRADKHRLKQVLEKLLSNAVKFSHANGVVRAEIGVSDNRVRLSVVDEGEGIPEGFRSRVFDPFSQLDSSDRRKFGGAGLGMYLAKKIIDAHGGHIDFLTELGEGTKFYVELDRVSDPRCTTTGEAGRKSTTGVLSKN